MKKKVLILGGAGFIGINLIDHFLKHSYEVIVYGRTMPSNFESKITFIKAGLSDILVNKDYLKSLEIDTAIYLINSFPVNSKASNYQKSLEQNKLLISEIIDVVNRFIFFSSGGRVYKSSEQPHKEDEPLSAICDYGKSKIELEQFITTYATLNNKKFLIIRPSNPYGPHQTLTGNQGLIAVLIGRIITAQTVDIWGSGHEVRDYIYINDFVNIFYKLYCLDSPRYNIYNIGSCTGESTLSILDVVRHLLPNHTIRTKYIPNDNIIKSNILCNDRVLDEIGSFKYTSLSSGIVHFTQWLHAKSNVK